MKGRYGSGQAGQDGVVNDDRRRASSWPASLLPTLLLVGLLAGGVGSATVSSDDEPILDMTVTATR